VTCGHAERRTRELMLLVVSFHHEASRVLACRSCDAALARFPSRWR
jgi:hypothetical protein